MRRVLIWFVGLILFGLGAALLLRFYEPAQLVLMWMLWIGTTLLVMVAGSLGLLD